MHIFSKLFSFNLVRVHEIQASVFEVFITLCCSESLNGFGFSPTWYQRVNGIKRLRLRLRRGQMGAVGQEDTLNPASAHSVQRDYIPRVAV